MTHNLLKPKKALVIGFITVITLSSLLFVYPATQKAYADYGPVTFDVVAGLDNVAVDGSCTLREAIGNINAGGGQPNSDCPASSAYSGDFAGNFINTIKLPEATITLTSDLPWITGPTNIIGKGQGKSIIDGNGQGVMFNLNPPHNNTYSFEYSGFTLKNITASGANACLAFSAYDPVTISVSKVDLEDCGSLGLLLGANDWYQGHTATLEDINVLRTDISYPLEATSTIGIGIINFQNVNINRASSRGNSMGIYLLGASSGGQPVEYSVYNTTLTENALGMYVKADGEYENYWANVNLKLANNTIFNNHQMEDQYIEGSDLNGGGLGFDTGYFVHYGTSDSLNVTMQNNIIAGNGGYLSDGQPVARNCGVGTGQGSLTVSTLGNNLSDNGCMDYLNSDDVVSSQISSTLGDFEDNGGYAKTMALLQGSPALDSGGTTEEITTDARGVARPYGAAYDIGAFELNGTDPLVEEPGPENPEIPDDIGLIPKVPRTGRVAIATLVTASFLTIILILARIYQKRYHSFTSTK